MNIIVTTHNGFIHDFDFEDGNIIINRNIYEAHSKPSNNNILSSAVSGNFIIFAIKSYGETNHIGIYNMITGDTKLSEIKLGDCISNIVPIFPGRFYASSGKTKQLLAFQFNPHTLEITDEGVHFELVDDSAKHTFFSSVYNFKGRWFGAIHDRTKHKSGCIIELSNQRIIYSGLCRPCNVFFNKDDRLCFIDYGQSMIVYGDDVFRSNGLIPTAFVEDSEENLWIAFGDNGENFISHFDTKKQKVIKVYDITDLGQVNSMIVFG